MKLLLEKPYVLVVAGFVLAAFGLFFANSAGGNAREMIISGGALVMSFGLVFCIDAYNDRHPQLAVPLLAIMLALLLVFFRAYQDSADSYLFGALGQLAAIVMAIAVGRGAVTFKN